MNLEAVMNPWHHITDNITRACGYKFNVKPRVRKVEKIFDAFGEWDERYGRW